VIRVHQSRWISLVEAVANVIVGYGFAVALQLLLYPFFGMHPTLGQSLQIGAAFMILSVLRSYAVRRVLERLRARSTR
jgi:membrane protein implicated in regulation of membrane protease activity